MRKKPIQIISEETGDLGVSEFENLPFVPKRFFWLRGVDASAVRANHAHTTCHQFLICQQGTLTAKISAGDGQVQIHSMQVGSSIHLKPLHWLELCNFSTDAVLGVFASEPYSETEYLTNKEDLTRIWSSTESSPR